MITRLRATLLVHFSVAACLTGLTACHSGDDKRPGQSLATVNGADITVHQVNAELRSVPPAPNARPEEQQRRALEQVIDRELLAAKAVDAKLDRDPAIMMAIERSKSQILAQAYMQGRMAIGVRPAKAEVDSYIEKHPELFANRKVYELRFLALPTGALNDEITGTVNHATSLDDLAASLSARKIAFTRGQQFRSSAELPQPLLADIDAVTKLPVFIMRDGAQAMLASLSYVKDAPVTGDQAVQQVEQFLANRKAQGIAQEEIAKLRRSSKIEYAPGSQPETSKQAPAAQAPGVPSPVARSAIDGGVAGLR